MLKTNSKKFKNSLRSFMMRIVTHLDENGKYIKSFEQLAPYVLNTFLDNKESCLLDCHNYEALFFDWLSGLPSCGLGGFLVWHPTSARGILRELLEETEEEAAKYTDIQTEKLLSSLMFRELLDYYEGFYNSAIRRKERERKRRELFYNLYICK